MLFDCGNDTVLLMVVGYRLASVGLNRNYFFQASVVKSRIFQLMLYYFIGSYRFLPGFPPMFVPSKVKQIS